MHASSERKSQVSKWRTGSLLIEQPTGECLRHSKIRLSARVQLECLLPIRHTASMKWLNAIHAMRHAQERSDVSDALHYARI